MSMVWDRVYELRPRTGLLFVPPDIWVWRIAAELYRQGKRKKTEKNLSQCHFVTINPTWTDPSANPVLRGDRPVINGPCYVLFILYVNRTRGHTFVLLTGLELRTLMLDQWPIAVRCVVLTMRHAKWVTLFPVLLQQLCQYLSNSGAPILY
jgi:hypothetical protein